jgi:hypothetical protein
MPNTLLSSIRLSDTLLIMKCYYPQSKPDRVHPCGQCLPCRINKRNAWTGRILLESTLHPYAVFVTLTYAPEYLPISVVSNVGPVQPISTLDPDDLQRHFKRLRKNGNSFRFYAVGEYGDLRSRPHYHYIAFTDKDPITFEKEVKKAWKSDNSKVNYYDTSTKMDLRGKVTVSLFTRGRAQYVAQYTTKKLTSEKSLPAGRVPEFSRSSMRPGIGHDAVIQMAYRLIKRLNSWHIRYHGCTDLEKMEIWRDFSQGCYRIDGKLYPMDRYIKEKMLDLIIGSKTLSEEKKRLMQRTLIQLSFQNRYDINQEAKQRHMAKVKTEKWRKEYIRRKKLIPSEDQL